MDRSRLISLIKEHSLKTGDFALASGRHSSYLIDLKMTTLHPEGSRLIADAILHHVRHYYEMIEAFGGMAVGAVPIVSTVVSRCLCKPIPGFYVRKATKGHGTNMLIDGWLQPGMQTVLVEDVITTGGSVLQAVEAIRAFGANVIEVIAVVDRLEGGEDNLAKNGIPLTSLLTREDLGI